MPKYNMRLLGWLLIGAMWMGCSPEAQNAQSQESKTELFAWLLGDWQRINESADKQTFEQWQMLSPSRYQGIGCTLQNGDTIWQESILLIQKEGKWYFEVSGENEPTATVFTVVEYNTISFRCENPDNEFPTAIEYTLEDDQLKAVISGDDAQIPFDFKRVGEN